MYFDDVDAIYEKAIDENVSVVMSLNDVFWMNDMAKKTHLVIFGKLQLIRKRWQKMK
jgi:peroxiredoxin